MRLSMTGEAYHGGGVLMTGCGGGGVARGLRYFNGEAGFFRVGRLVGSFVGRLLVFFF